MKSYAQTVRDENVHDAEMLAFEARGEEGLARLEYQERTSHPMALPVLILERASQAVAEFRDMLRAPRRGEALRERLVARFPTRYVLQDTGELRRIPFTSAYPWGRRP